MNNHGSHAKVGDLVEILNSIGDATGMTGVVYKEEIVDTPLLERRVEYIYITGCYPHRVRKNFVIILSRA